jgi:hypothetical protein
VVRGRLFAFASLALVAVSTACPSPPSTPQVSPTLDTRPTQAPTVVPTVVPTVQPTIAPTVAPTIAPTVAPTTAPTVAPTAAAATRPAAATPAAGADARTALGEVFSGWVGVKTFRARLAGQSARPGATPIASEMEVVLPDRFRAKMATGGQNMEMVFISGTAYMKLGASPWIKAPTGAPLDLSTLDPKRFESDFRGNVSNVRLVGPDVVEGTPTLVYTYDVAPAAGAPVKTGPVSSKIWVGVADRLPRRLEVTSPTGEVTNITYYDYNAPITVEAPAGV